jgi:TRAP-type mannitol/chloroaromatic compound transport system substrate-binding protein
MRRREFIKKIGAGTLAVGAGMAGMQAAEAKAEFKWKMVTTWPKNFPGLGTGANKLAEVINQMSGGRMHVKVYGAKELVPAFEVFDAVERGTA